MTGKRGEITTFLTVFALVLMLTGFVVGQKLQTPISYLLKASTPNYCGIRCFPSGGDSGCRGGTVCDPNTKSCTSPLCEAPTAKCNQGCTSSLNCNGLGCYKGHCRNTVCIDKEDCNCGNSTPTSSPPSPTPTTIPVPTGTASCGDVCSSDSACQSLKCNEGQCTNPRHPDCTICLDELCPIPTDTPIPTINPTTAPTTTPTPTLLPCGRPCGRDNNKCKSQSCIYGRCTSVDYPGCFYDPNVSTQKEYCDSKPTSFNCESIVPVCVGTARSQEADANDRYFCENIAHQIEPTATLAPTPIPTSSEPTATPIPTQNPIRGCRGLCSTSANCQDGLTCSAGLCRNAQCTGTDNIYCQCTSGGGMVCGDLCTYDQQCQTGYCDRSGYCRNRSCSLAEQQNCVCQGNGLVSTSATVNLTNNSSKTVTNITIKLCKAENDCVIQEQNVSVPPGRKINLEKKFEKITNKTNYNVVLMVTYGDGSKKEKQLSNKVTADNLISVSAQVSDTAELDAENTTVLNRLDGNHDQVITTFDFAMFLSSGEYGKCSENLKFDIDEDGCVNALDISYFPSNLDKTIE